MSYVQRSLEQKGFEATLEPIYKLGSGVLKPDLVAKKDNRAFIVDAQIVGEGIDIQEAHKTKVLKYSGRDLLSSIRSFTGASQVFVTSDTLNWRGIWSRDSAESLLGFGLISNRDLKVIAVRDLEMTAGIFSRFMGMTALRGLRNCSDIG